MGKNVNIDFSRNFDIFAIKMTYLNARSLCMCPIPFGKNSMQTQYHINSSVFGHRILIKNISPLFVLYF